MKVIIFIFLAVQVSFAQDLTRWVDPFIGTGGHGHTFPGATVPFGMVQLSPDTDIQGWDWCSGYHASDSTMMGFSHTHLSGTGGSDYGDILLMPFTGEVMLEPGPKDQPDLGYRSRFRHETESASPGYYSVQLDDYGIKAELTATARVGFHRYTFPDNETAKVILDLAHGISDRVIESRIEVVNDREIIGLRRSRGWASDQRVFFAIRFSRPFVNAQLYKDGQARPAMNQIESRDGKAVLYFQEGAEPLMVKVALSSVDTDGARKNLNAELDHWDFENVRTEAGNAWNQHLGRIIVEGGSEEQNTIFYTALYHTMIHPNIFNDVDGRYRGMDNEIHTSPGGDHYTLFSLWDTFRATHPLYNLLFPERNQAFIRSMIAKYDEHGLLPVWELWSNETGTMIGYHSVPVIVDAYLKGYRDFDVDKAYEAVKKSAMQDHLGLKDYRELEFIPLDREGNSVSKTLEYAYDDWCIAMMAKELGKDEDYKTFLRRAQHYQNQFDPESGMMRGRYANGRWRGNFSPVTYSALGAGDFTEGNSWQYTWSVQQDISGLIRLMGGEEKFEATLDHLFAADYDVAHRPSDVTGLIGEYAHGNEPSHHVAYLYNFIGKPVRTQEMVRRILNEMYSTGRDGLSGNEDCGQMSAWYVFSAMGFYPVTPGRDEYVFGSPLFKTVILNLPNGNRFRISAPDNNAENVYIKTAELNGKSYLKSYIGFNDIMQGGILRFEMSANRDDITWGKSVEERPVSEIRERVLPVGERRVFQPYFEDGGPVQLFRDAKIVRLGCMTDNAEIRYTLAQTLPDTLSIRYESPFTIDRTTNITARAFKSGLESSEPLYGRFMEAFCRSAESPYPEVRLKYDPHRRYAAEGAASLMDGRFGIDRFGEGGWLGFEKNDLIATIDLGDVYPVRQVSARFLRSIGSWIFLPVSVEIRFAVEADVFDSLGEENLDGNVPDAPTEIITYAKNTGDRKARYIEFKARNIERCPEWHSGKGGPAFLFCDEIIVESLRNKKK